MYKTIVVYLSNSPASQSTMAAAAGLARRMDAHLVGTVSSGVAELDALMRSGAPMAAMVATDSAALRAEGLQRLQRFEQDCRELGVDSCEARLLDIAPADALLLQSRYCDLLVAGQEDMLGGGMLVPARLPGMLVTQAARPVLLVPSAYRGDVAFDQVMVAWNGSLGASRAIAFALPLLARASKVYVAVCNAAEERLDVGSEPGVDLAVYLSRLHRNVELVRRDSGESVDATLHALATELGVGLIVAGAFGHGRLHDWVLGSTTRGLIARASVPLLMTH